jgi:hypothetical protein
MAERIGLLSGQSNSRAGWSNGGNQAAARVARWRAQPPFNDPEIFSQRLASDGIAEVRSAVA